jgi:membrane fusion protein, multidrug efflux system
VAQAATIPTSAVNQGPNGPFAYVVGANNKVAVRPITVMATEGTTAVIQAGLKPGETVVTDGQMSLKPGSTVNTGGPGGAGHGGGGGGKKHAS